MMAALAPRAPDPLPRAPALSPCRDNMEEMLQQRAETAVRLIQRVARGFAGRRKAANARLVSSCPQPCHQHPYRRLCAVAHPRPP